MIVWSPRDLPLEPRAVAAAGECASALAAAALRRDDEALARLRGVAGGGIIVILGEAEALPWADGAEYLGRDAEAPGLLLPTSRIASIPAGLLEQAVSRHCQAPLPIAMLAASRTFVSVASARPISRSRLEKLRAASC